MQEHGLMTWFIRLQNEWSRANIVVTSLACFGVLLGVAYLDYMTGVELHFFLFFTLPIWMATWRGSYLLGGIFAALSIISWAVVDSMSFHEYSTPLIPWWNGTIRFIFFMFIVYSVNNIKSKYMLEQMHADYDSLTQLLNGRGFRERLNTLFPLIRRDRKICTIAFVDVDNFKHVNDSLGHAEGDRLLTVSAGVMKSTIRTSDVICRIGGDEFVIFLPNTNAEQSEIVLEKLKSKLKEATGHEGWPIGFSVGAYTFNSTELNLQEALAKADELMYQAKRAGKDRIMTLSSF